MNDLLASLREACASVAERAKCVRVERDRIPGYAAALPLDATAPAVDPAVHLTEGNRESLAAFWLTLDAINFGSGWFPTMRKRDGRSGYYTVAAGVRDRFVARGPWSAAELERIDRAEVAEALGQEPDHELMALFARSLNDLGHRVAREHDGRFEAVLDAADDSAEALDSAGAGDSAEALVNRLAGWDCFADASEYEGLTVPFLKRAQIAAADLARAGVARFDDLDRLTMFADNLVPHVLRLDGILTFEPQLVGRIERGELIEHRSPEEVEIRACGLHAVELIVAARPDTRAMDVDQLLWHRGQEARYKAVPRHRSRCTAY
jgi:hypothetical protein